MIDDNRRKEAQNSADSECDKEVEAHLDSGAWAARRRALRFLTIRLILSR